jgi:hypothetical protein
MGLQVKLESIAGGWWAAVIARDDSNVPVGAGLRGK